MLLTFFCSKHFEKKFATRKNRRMFASSYTINHIMKPNNAIDIMYQTIHSASELKQNIIKVVYHALEQSKKTKCKGIRYSLKPGELYAKTTFQAFKTALDNKIILFCNMSEECESFKSIHNAAKKALVKLQNRNYDFDVIEFINIFFSIESVFIKNLKYVGIRELDFKGMKVSTEPDYTLPPPVNDEVIYLDETVSGKDITKLDRKILKQTEL